MSDIISSLLNKSSERSIPLQATLELTHRCNERCLHCYIDDFSDDEKELLNIDQYRDILDQLRSAGTLYLILMGGEPTLSKLFIPLIEEGVRRGMHVSAISNGVKLKDKSLVFSMKNAGISQMTLSLYSIKSDIHDMMTSRKGSFKDVMYAIDNLNEAGIKFGINTLLTKLNIDSFYELLDWAMDNDIAVREDLTITPKFDSDLSPTYLRATDEQIHNYWIERIRRFKSGRPQKNFTDLNARVCNVARSKCAIDPYGNLYGCVELRDDFGNLKNDSFETLWNSEKANKYRNIRNSDIKGLKLSDSFCEHCLGQAHFENGDYFKVTTDSLRLANIKKKYE